MTTATAAVFREVGGDISIEQIDVDDPAPNEVLVRTAACGVCHSDLHFMQGSIAGPIPSVPGHEPAGVVEAVGSRRPESVEVGDHVIACTSMFCGTLQAVHARAHPPVRRTAATACARRTPRRGCPSMVSRSSSSLTCPGSAEMMLLHERAVVKVPDDIPLDRSSAGRLRGHHRRRALP